MTLLLASIVDVTVVLALALVAATALKRRSAALRHLVLAAAIVAATLSPALELLVPQLPVIHWDDTAPAASPPAIATPAEAPSESGAVVAAAPGTPAIPWTTLLLTAWMLGAVVALAGLLTGLVRLGRLTARSVPVRAGRWREMADELSRASALRRRVALLQSTDPSLLVTCGVLRPKILLPAGAASWIDDRRHIVLAHEMAHIRRHDGAWQLAGEILRVVHWFNPLVWLACRRLRQESEHACDDVVLRDGIEATEYATHLLDVARHVGRHHTWASAPAIADASTLERRVSAMLNRHRNREPLTRRARAVAVLAVVAVIVPLAAAGVAPPPDWPVSTLAERSDVGLTPPPAAPEPALSLAARGTGPTAQTAPSVTTPQAPAAITGAVLDQSGGALPGATLTLTDTAGVQHTTSADNAGRFAFRDLQPARYELAASLSGFATMSTVVPLAAGGTSRIPMILPLGTIETTINVLCDAAPVATAASPRPSVASTGHASSRLRLAWFRTLQAIAPVLSAQQQPPVRVGGNIQAPTKIMDVKPGCPTTPFPGTNTVRLRARIDADGSVNEVTPIAAEPGAARLPAFTIVRLVGRIGVDGSMEELTPVAAAEPGAPPPPAFIESALAAVRQWRFTPARLNGEAVDVNITIRVYYRQM